MTHAHQLELWDAEINALEEVAAVEARLLADEAAIRPADPNVPPEAAPRLSRQSLAILAMMAERPRTGSELATVTHRFGGRLYDLRKAGCAITCDLDHKTGVATYTLTHEPEGLR